VPRLSPEPREGFVAVGRIVRPWGLRGDVKVQSLTDVPERFDPGSTLWLAGTRRTVAAAREHRGALYLKLAGVDDAEAAEALRGELLEVPERELAPLDEDEFYNFQLIGLDVRTDAGDVLGRVAEVLPTGGNAVLVVRGDRGELLLPFIDEVVQTVDLAAGLMTVTLIEGLVDDTPPKPPRQATWKRRRPPAPAPD
jgi:16S rRNA processing protein RimM